MKDKWKTAGCGEAWWKTGGGGGGMDSFKSQHEDHV